MMTVDYLTLLFDKKEILNLIEQEASLYSPFNIRM